MAAFKHVDRDEGITLFGHSISKGAVVALDQFSLTMDPEYIDDPEEYVPERWLADAVESRKGTPREVVDHPFLKEPFSQGTL